MSEEFRVNDQVKVVGAAGIWVVVEIIGGGEAELMDAAGHAINRLLINLIKVN